MKRSWIKLYVELLDDDKLGPLPVWLKWRFVELLLVAAEGDDVGTLPPVTRLAWRLRVSEDDLLKSLCALSEIGVVCEQGDHWKVTNFEKRQSAMSTAERVKEYRKRKGNEPETKRYANDNDDDVTSSLSISPSNSDSPLEEGGVGGETAESLFVDSFGKMYQREKLRWAVLFEAVGKDKAEELISWAFKKEIHLTNRGGLLDSLETAAKNWRGGGSGNGIKPDLTKIFAEYQEQL